MKKIICISLALILLIPFTSFAKQTVFSGSGDDVISIGSIKDGYVFYIEGNTQENHFAIKAYDQKGDYLELLVNTTDSYKGITMDPSLETTMLEINASGSWKLELLPLSSLDMIIPGQLYSGRGDTVLLLNSGGSIARIKGNSSENHFAVRSYSSTRTDLLVNTTDRYEGNVMLRSDPFILEIKAVGDWSIDIN